MSPFLTEMLHRRIGDRAERLAHRLGQAQAVVGAVVDHADLVPAEAVLHVVGDRRPLHAVVAQAAEERPPPLLRQRDVGRRRGDRDEAGLVEHVAGGVRFAGERGPDQADGERVVDDLGCDLGGLLRITLGVEGLQLYLAARIGGVVLVDRQLDAVLDVDAQLGVGPVERSRHRDGHRWALRLAVAGGIGSRSLLGRWNLCAVLVDLHLLDDLQVGRRCAPLLPHLGSACCWQPAMPSTTKPALPIANALRATRPRTFHLRVNVFVGVDAPPQLEGTADASS